MGKNLLIYDFEVLEFLDSEKKKPFIDKSPIYISELIKNNK